MFLKNTQPDTKLFEIVMCVRDSQGNDTGKRKSFASDSPYKIWETWSRYVANIPTKAKKNILPSGKEAEAILASMWNTKDENK